MLFYEPKGDRKRRLMKAKVLMCVSLLVLAMAGCTDEKDNQAQTVTLKNFANSGCKDNTRSGYDGREEIAEYAVHHEGYLYVNHQNAVFNCCPGTIGADILVEDNRIIIGEYESSGDCDCICPYDLSYEVGPLVEGTTYTIYIGYKGIESKVAEFTFQNSMSGVWELGTD